MHPTWHHVDSHEFCDSTFVPPFPLTNYTHTSRYSCNMKAAINADTFGKMPPFANFLSDSREKPFLVRFLLNS